MVPEDPIGPNEDKEAEYDPVLVDPVSTDIFADEIKNIVFVPEELTDESAKLGLDPLVFVPPVIFIEDPNELSEDTTEPEFIPPTVVPKEPDDKVTV